MVSDATKVHPKTFQEVSTIKPLANHVLIVQIRAAERRVVVPEKFNDPRRSKQYYVLAVGPGRLLKNGQRLAPEVDVRDFVMFSGDFDHKELEDGRKLVNADQLIAKWSAQI